MAIPSRRGVSRLDVGRVRAVAVVTRLLCLVLGGHDWQGPRIADGKVRMVCGYGCGAQSQGIETRGMEQQRVERTVCYLNLRIVRSAQRKVA